MKKILVYIFSVFLIVSSLYAGAVVTDFRGEAGFNRVELKWIVAAETNLKGYRIFRSLDGVSYENIAFVKAKSADSGEKTYIYVDKSVFKSTGRSYYYKLQFVNADETTTDFDKVVVVEPKISAARHTWGSIKAMFR